MFSEYLLEIVCLTTYWTCLYFDKQYMKSVIGIVQVNMALWDAVQLVSVKVIFIFSMCISAVSMWQILLSKMTCSR